MTFVAHGIGGSTDLPVPLSYALVGAAWALTFTFAIVALAWRKPRFDPDKPGRPLPRWVTRFVDASLTRRLVAVLGLAFTVWVLMAGLFGPQNSANALPGVFYVLLWVGLVTVSLAVGPVWRVVSPMRTLYRMTLSHIHFRRLRYPAALGYFPAAFGLFAFVWLELASPDPGSLRNQGLAAGICGGHDSRRRPVVRTLVRQSRPVRGVQRCGFTVVAIPARS